jgi:hypothetical protein
MATKTIEKFVTSLNANNAPETLRKVGEHCVKQCYAGNGDDTDYALNNLAQCWRAPLASWLSARGVILSQNGKVYTVGEVAKDDSGAEVTRFVKKQGNQAKAIEAAKTVPVLITEQVAKKEKGKSDLKGCGESRAKVKMAETIRRLKKSDPEAGNALNDLWTQKVAGFELEADNEVWDLSPEEARQVVMFIKNLRSSISKLKKVA